MANAYSYIRFSSERQATGDSLRRQLEQAQAYASAHGLILDDSTYRDLGISAFKGKNAEEGALSAFLEAVDKSKIPDDSYLLIESFDRLSRLPVDLAMELFMSITRRGVTVVTLHDKQTYSRETIRENWTKLVVALATMARANEESENKSRVIRDEWAARFKKAAADPTQIIRKSGPSWLIWREKEKKWEPIHEMVEVIKLIFKLSYEGNGSPTITKHLNKKGIKPFGSAEQWNVSSVMNILSNPAVIGTLHSSDPSRPSIPNYYPTIIEPELFIEVGERARGRKWIGGRGSEKVNNLFAGYLYCHGCGARMRIAGARGKVGSPSRYVAVRCQNSLDGAGCSQPVMKLHAIEETLLGRYDNQGRQLAPPVEQLEKDTGAEIELQINDINKRITQNIRLAELAGDLTEIATRITELKKQAAELAKQRDRYAALKATPEIEQEAKRWFKDLQKLEGDALVQLRKKIQASLLRFIKRVDVDASSYDIFVEYQSGRKSWYGAQRLRPKALGRGRPRKDEQ